MQPTQAYTPPPPPPNQYDFITNPGRPPKKPLLGGNGSLKSRLLLVGGIAVVLVIIIAIVGVVLGSAGQAGNNALKSLVIEQEELIRIADMGADDAIDVSIRAYATTTKLSLQSQQNDLKNYLEERNIEITKLELTSKKNTKIDDQLEQAVTANRYDETFKEILDEKLTSYYKNLSSTYKQVSGDNIKKLLSSSYDSTENLLKL